MYKQLSISIIFFLVVLSSRAQFETIELTINNSLKSLSYAEGESRNWDAFKDAFLENGRLSVLINKDSVSDVHSFTVQEFIDVVSGMEQPLSFYEKGLKLHIHEINGIAQVFQPYELSDGAEKIYGVNAYDLVFIDGRWWIQSIIWTTAESKKELKKWL